MAGGTPTPAQLEGPFAPGTVLGKYELVATIGKGGMASVILARTRGPAGFEKLVVIKVIHPHLAKDEAAVAMLLDEARLAALIDHPNVVHTHELGEAHGTFYIVMEYLAGESFHQVLRRASSIPPGELAVALHPHLAGRIVSDACEGLHAAHELVDFQGRKRGIVHRDVSPGNIVVLYSGAVKVVDFGIAKAHGRVTNTGDGDIKGKFGYMSPEQINNEPMDRRSDVFALGVVLWEALAMRRLFYNDSVGATLMQILNGKRVPPSHHQPGVPRALDDIALRALSPDPRARFQTATEMKQAIDDEIWRSRMGVGEIQKYMTALFADRIEQRRLLIARATAHEPLTRILETLVADTSSVIPLPTGPSTRAGTQPPTALAELVELPDSGAQPTVELPPAAPKRTGPRSRAPLVILVGIAAIAGVTAGVVGYGLDGDLPAKRAAQVAPVEAPVQPTAQPIELPEEPVAMPALPDAAVEEVPVAPTAPSGEEQAAAEAAKLEQEKRDRRRKRRERAEGTVGTGDTDDGASGDDRPATPTAPPPDKPTGSATALTKSGTDLYIAGKFAEAEAAFKQALAIDATHAPAHKGLGFVYQRLGNKAKAIASLERYLELRPSASDAAAIRRRIDELEGT
ncbi:MAG TPA: tetratricopeptide repeat protein [Kofleriaceae bacterium]